MANQTAIRWLKSLSLLGVILAFSVILLGAYTRLKDAGLGCPDWPGCYGQFSAPSTPEAIKEAHLLYPTSTVDVAKAHTEMTHRYFAESLGALIVVFAIVAFFARRKYSFALPTWLPGFLVILVLFQGMLGMWTVTMRLLPLAVVGHLLGGFCTLGLLWLCVLYLYRKNDHQKPGSFISSGPLRIFALMTLGVVFCQILLGGWTSANYAALICPDFPTCQGQWWPQTHFASALNFLGGLGMENPLAYLDTPGRTSIQLMHRLGACITLLFSVFLIVAVWRVKSLRKLCVLIGLVLSIQLGLGISNILFSLPLAVAVAHNGVGALLLLSLITLNFSLRQGER